MKKKSAIAALALALLALPGSGAPVTKAQLLSMARDKVDPRVVRAIVERDCIDFDVDADNAAELSKALPADVLEAAIACRRVSAGAPRPESPAEAKPAVAEPAPAARATPAGGSLRVEAEFIGESAELACSCSIDGELLATLTKEAQGSFGEAVPRTKIVRRSADLPVASGKHRVLIRCDPKGQEVDVRLDVAPGQHRVVAVRETALRRWKLRKVE